MNTDPYRSLILTPGQRTRTRGGRYAPEDEYPQACKELERQQAWRRYLASAPGSPQRKAQELMVATQAGAYTAEAGQRRTEKRRTQKQQDHLDDVERWFG